MTPRRKQELTQAFQKEKLTIHQIGQTNGGRVKILFADEAGVRATIHTGINPGDYRADKNLITSAHRLLREAQERAQQQDRTLAVTP